MKRFIPTKDAIDKGRFDAFTDGVFAVAVTHVVLEMYVPISYALPGSFNVRRHLRAGAVPE